MSERLDAESRKSKTPPVVPAKPKELKAAVLSRRAQYSPSVRNVPSSASSEAARSSESVATDNSIRKKPENYYGKKPDPPEKSSDSEPEPPTKTASSSDAPPLPPRIPSRTPSYYGQSVGKVLDTSEDGSLGRQEQPQQVSAPPIAQESLPRPLPPRPQPAVVSTPAVPMPPPSRTRAATPEKLILRTKAVNSRPPAADGPPISIKRGLSSLSIDQDYICTGGSSCAIFNAHTLANLWSKSTDKVVSSVQVGGEVWLGMRDGRICIVDPHLSGYVDENGRHHRRPIVHMWYDSNFVLALSADGKLSIWNPNNFKTPHQVHRVIPNFKSATYKSPYLWVMKNRQVNIYDPLLQRGGFQVLPHSIEYGERGSSTVGEYSCGYAGEVDDLTVLGHNDGTISTYKDFVLTSTVTLGYSGVLSIVKAGPYYWIGLRTGSILVVDLKDHDATLLKEWKAHSGPVELLVASEDAELVLSGSTNEAVGVWESSLREDLRVIETQKQLDETAAFKDLKIQVFVWNVGCANPKNVNEHVFWRELSTKYPADIIVFGLQEVTELDNKSKTAKNFIKAEEDLEHEHKAWRRFLCQLLEEEYGLAADRALVGLYSCVFISQKLIASTKNVSTNVVKTGFGGLHGNKGATLICMDVFDSSFSFVNVHLAAGQSSALQRNKDAETIVSGGEDAEGHAKLRPLDHEYCFFFGDTNYRVNTVRENASKLIQTKSWDKLFAYDQLGRQLTKNPRFVLAGFHEMPIQFPPTYKFDVGSNRYDSSDKQRVPSWCDRVLYRGSNVEPVVYDSLEAYESDHRPVMCTLKVKAKLYLTK